MSGHIEQLAAIVDEARKRGLPVAAHAHSAEGIGEEIDKDMIAVPLTGELVSVLEKFCAPFPGYFPYYPQRQRALRALVEHLQRWRRGSAGRTHCPTHESS